jgi:hypothetical protein
MASTRPRLHRRQMTPRCPLARPRPRDQRRRDNSQRRRVIDARRLVRVVTVRARGPCTARGPRRSRTRAAWTAGCAECGRRPAEWAQLARASPTSLPRSRPVAPARAPVPGPREGPRPAPRRPPRVALPIGASLPAAVARVRAPVRVSPSPSALVAATALASTVGVLQRAVAAVEARIPSDPEGRHLRAEPARAGGSSRAAAR